MPLNASFSVDSAIRRAAVNARAVSIYLSQQLKLCSLPRAEDWLWPFLRSAGSLPEDVWSHRHRLLLALTWLHALIIAFLGPVIGYSWEISFKALFKDGTVLHTAWEGFIVALLAVLASCKINRRLKSVLVACALMTSSAIFVHLSGGYIELHFHFFVMIIFLAFYQDWIPFIAGILYVAVHHGVVGVLWPEDVYNHEAAINAPWTWAAIHAFFVLCASVGSVITWRYNAMAYTETARFAEENERRRREAEELARLAKSLTETLDMAAVGKRIVMSVQQLIGVKIATLRLLHPDGSLRALASSGDSPRGPAGEAVTPGTGLTSRAIKEERPIWCADMLKDPEIHLTDRMRDYQLRSGNRSMIVVPLRAHEKVIGVLGLSDRTGRTYSDSEVALVQTFADQAALALENAQLMEETESRAQEQAALNIVANAVSQSLDRDELLKIALDKVLEVTRRERVSIRLKDPTTGEVGLAASRGFSHEEIEDLRHRTRHQATEQVLATGQPLVVDNRQAFSGTQSLLPRSFSVAWIPIKAGARVVGVLGISAGSPVPFFQREVDFLQAIANVIGVAIENARLFGQTKHNLEQIRLLHEIGTALTSTLDLHDLLKVFLEKIDDALPYSAGSVRLFNRESGLLEPTACRNLDVNEWRAEPWRGGRGIPNVVFENRAPLMVRNLQNDPRIRDPQFFRKHELVSYLGTPLIVRDEILGVLSVYTKEDRAFSHEEIEFLSTLASHAAMAIHNSQLHEQTTKQAIALENSNETKDEMLQLMARQKEELARLNDGLQNEIAERGRARAELAAKNRDLETLLYVISHDLREPLRAIENFSRIVNDRYKNHLDEKGQDFLRRVILGAQRLNHLLDDILTLSRSQRMDAPTEEIDGETIVLEALRRLEGKISATNAQVRLAKNFNGLRVDKTWATQAIYNLIVNALKFTRNGEAPDVEIVPYQPQGPDSKVVGIAVRDRGPGVAPEHVERIFQLFQRAVGRDIEGTGAGLAIVRQIAERHGGNAWVEPREGGGSEFVITFGHSKDVQGGSIGEY
jgi:GAF domain-containing protein